jgi:thiamine pyrophosphate-dependent acetolactate synthase large subunit-like protein
MDARNCTVLIMHSLSTSAEPLAPYPVLVHGVEELPRILKKAIYSWQTQHPGKDLLDAGSFITIEME